MYSPDFYDNPSGVYSLKSRRISPRDEISGNMHVSTTRSYSLGTKKNKKNVCKSWRNKKGIAVSKRSSREFEELSKLTRQFLTYRFSAAGVRYIVRSRSKCRKILWFIAIVLTVVFMGYMTFNVIKEYLNFPKMLIREDRITPKLGFPAVTLCSLNPIFNLTSNDSSVYKFMKLKGLINRAEVIPSNEYLRDECYFHPLCQWSWFDETCNCVKNPCQTEFCLPENATHCVCSLNICRDFDKFTSCYANNNSNRCICSIDTEYMDYQELEDYNRKNRFDNVSDEISKPVRDIMELIRNANTYDLVDLEESLIPTANDLLEYGIKFDNLVLSCSFDAALCFRENFTVLYHQLYGRCYMFNYLGDVQNKAEQPAFAYNYGSSSGLRLILHVLKQDKIDLLNSEIGARIVIHDPYSLPFVAEYGINVRPHDMSAIEVKQSVVKRLKPPYGTCVDDGSHLKFNLPAGQPYSILGCQKACRHYYLMKACNCTKRNYILGSVFYTKTTQTIFCKLVNKTQYDCMVSIISKIELGHILCDCRPSCIETIYSTTVSSSDLNENYYKAVKNIRTFYTDAGTPKTINATDERNLMVGIKVYYSTFQVNTDNEQASYSWETLIANIGGNLGFFMGLTLVTFMEVLEFFWDILFTTIRQYRDPRARPDRPHRMFHHGNEH